MEPIHPGNTFALEAPVPSTHFSSPRLNNMTRIFPGSRIAISESGSLGGFAGLCAGELDLSGASQKISEKHKQQCAEAGFEPIPYSVAVGGVTIVVPVENDFVDSLSMDELKTIWQLSSQSKVTQWSDIRPDFPDIPLTLVGPGTNSGTFHIFVEKVLGTSGEMRTDFFSCEDDNLLVQAVYRNPGSLGFFGFNYLQANRDRLRAVPIRETATPLPILPTAESLSSGLYKPLTRSLFVYARKEALRSPQLRDFLEFLLSKSPQLAREQGFISLPDEVVAIELLRLERHIHAAEKEGRNP